MCSVQEYVTDEVVKSAAKEPMWDTTLARGIIYAAYSSLSRSFYRTELLLALNNSSTSEGKP